MLPKRKKFSLTRRRYRGPSAKKIENYKKKHPEMTDAEKNISTIKKRVQKKKQTNKRKTENHFILRKKKIDRAAMVQNEFHKEIIKYLCDRYKKLKTKRALIMYCDMFRSISIGSKKVAGILKQSIRRKIEPKAVFFISVDNRPDGVRYIDKVVKYLTTVDIQMVTLENADSYKNKPGYYIVINETFWRHIKKKVDKKMSDEKHDESIAMYTAKIKEFNAKNGFLSKRVNIA